MKVVRSVPQLREIVGEWKSRGERVGLVPTMGFLHAGHLSLIDLVRSAGCERTVVSIFVNPSQFAPGEDFERYPRDEAADVNALESRGVDLLFAPDVDQIYPRGFATRIEVGGPAGPLEGQRRPGHFSGVATVVLKLLNMVQPDMAAFGRKDAQQCAVIDRLVRDLDVPVQLLFGETIRESDGLAMSSRNSYLDPAERQRAAVLSEALRRGADLSRTSSPSAVEAAMAQEVAKQPGVELDYLRVVDPLTFETPLEDSGSWLLAGAVRVGRTRLIDNMLVERRGVHDSKRT